MSRPRKYSDQQIILLKEDYETLNSYRAVGRKWKISSDTVKYLLDSEYRTHKNKNNKDRKDSKRPRITKLPDAKKVLVWGAMKRSREYDIPFNITTENIVVPDICPVLGIPLVYGASIGKPQAGSLSLDRIVPEKGYVPGNIKVISFRANTIKSNATISELEAVLSYVRKGSENG